MDVKDEREKEFRMIFRVLVLVVYLCTEIEFIGREVYCGRRGNFRLYVFFFF